MSDVQNAKAAMAFFDGAKDSVVQAISAINAFHIDARDPQTDEFPMPLNRVLADPFA